MALEKLHSIVWNPFLLCAIVVVGIIFTIYLKGIQFRYLKPSLKLLFSFQRPEGEGNISSFQALMTALAGIVGVGNIAGVATAITIGGLGAIFWMWVSGILGMAISFAENTLSVCYRIKDKDGKIVGGPMYYLRDGLKSKILAVFFCLATLASSFGLGNFVQAQTVSDATNYLFGIPPIYTGIFFALCIGVVLIGGIKRIAKVAAICVPFMGFLYCSAGLAVILFYWKNIPFAVFDIFQEALSPKAAVGGVAGMSLVIAMRAGIARGIFSNEAGLGSAPIASSEAKVPYPAYQGLMSMIGTFLSTCLVCTVTGLVIQLTGVHSSGELKGVALTIAAFQHKLMFGGVVVGICIFIFGYTTSLGWAYYGERSLDFLFGKKVIPFYRVIFTLVLVCGSLFSLDFVWLYADIANGLMVYPNLIALLFLAKKIKEESRKLSKTL